MATTCAGHGQRHTFRDGETYKIRSAHDGSVLDLCGGKTKEGTKLINWNWNGHGNQRWTAWTEGTGGGFRLEPNLPMHRKVVLDLHTEKGEAIIFGFHGKANQQWVAEVSPTGYGAVLITNLQTGTCLENRGHGQTVKCSPKDFNSKRQLWYIALT